MVTTKEQMQADKKAADKKKEDSLELFWKYVKALFGHFFDQKNNDTKEKEKENKHKPQQHSTIIQSIKGDLSISDLMKKYHVTADDLQAICDKIPEAIGEIGGGGTCKKLARAADKVRTKYGSDGKPKTGDCVIGTRRIYNNAGISSLSCKQAWDAMAEARKSYQNTNGGCNGYKALDASGDTISIAIKNTAYGKKRDSKEDLEMNEFFNLVQPGVTISVDSIEDPKVRAKQGNTKGGKYGHIAVKRSDGNWGCDFNQKDINFARYGEYAHISFPKDAKVPAELAKLLVAQAISRQQAQARQQQTQYYAMASAKSR